MLLSLNTIAVYTVERPEVITSKVDSTLNLRYPKKVIEKLVASLTVWLSLHKD